jgi:hypothetical protein
MVAVKWRNVMRPKDDTHENDSPPADKGSEIKMIMTPEHPQWSAFMDLLTGPEGCNFRIEENGPMFTCGGRKRPLARAILKKHFPQVDIEGTIDFFESHGGHCDCEIAFNVETSFECKN